MRDDRGEEWLPVDEAARVVRVRVETIRVWVTRGKVRTALNGRNRHVHMGDLRHAEAAWRARLRRKRRVV